MNEDATVPIPCPTCGEKTEKSLGWLKTNDHFTCGCGSIRVRSLGYLKLL